MVMRAQSEAHRFCAPRLPATRAGCFPSLPRRSLVSACNRVRLKPYEPSAVQAFDRPPTGHRAVPADLRIESRSAPTRERSPIDGQRGVSCGEDHQLLRHHGAPSQTSRSTGSSRPKRKKRTIPSMRSRSPSTPRARCPSWQIAKPAV